MCAECACGSRLTSRQTSRSRTEPSNVGGQACASLSLIYKTLFDGLGRRTIYRTRYVHGTLCLSLSSAAHAQGPGRAVYFASSEHANGSAFTGWGTDVQTPQDASHHFHGWHMHMAVTLRTSFAPPAHASAFGPLPVTAHSRVSRCSTSSSPTCRKAQGASLIPSP